MTILLFVLSQGDDSKLSLLYLGSIYSRQLKKTAHFMVAAYGQQHFVSVETPSTYVPPQPGSHANSVGLYSNELVAAPNPKVGEEARVVAVLDAATERRLGLDAT
jgi:hypothetical protein